MAKELVKHQEPEDSLPAGYDLSELQADAALNPQLEAGDVALPYLTILQGLSPQVSPASPTYLPEARQGMIYNTVLGEVYEGQKEGLLIVPCAYERNLVEWVPREKGGGIVAVHEMTSSILEQARPDERGRPLLPNGNLVVETANHYVLFQHPETGKWSQAILAMSSTFLKVNRKLNNLIAASLIPGTQTPAPRWLYAYAMTTRIETKNNNSWFVPDFKKVESPIAMDLYRHGKKFAQMVNSGKVAICWFIDD